MRNNATVSSATANERAKRSAALAGLVIAGLSLALIVAVWLWTRDIETAVAVGIVAASAGVTVISLCASGGAG